MPIYLLASLGLSAKSFKNLNRVAVEVETALARFDFFLYLTLAEPVCEIKRSQMRTVGHFCTVMTTIGY